jgi:hypothetical protein
MFMLKKNRSMSFYRAVHEGYIKGPDWAVVDSETEKAKENLDNRI